MPKKAHTEEQIVAALQRVESGEKVGEVCRGLGISQGTFYVWKKHCAGLGVPSCESCASCGKKTGG